MVKGFLRERAEAERQRSRHLPPAESLRRAPSFSATPASSTAT